MTSALILRIGSTAVLAAGLLAQDAATPTFKTNTNLVVVNIWVKDKSGKAIEDLKKERFTLLEDGKPQQIAVFELQHLNGETLPALEAPEPTLKSRPAEPPKAAPAPAGPVTADQLKDRRLIAMFFDLSSMQAAEQVRARDAAVKFIDTQMTASDMISIMTLTNDLRVVQEFTGDRETLLTAIQSLHVGDSSDLAGQGPTGADSTDDSGEFTADDTEFNIFNTDRKLSALEDAARKLAPFPEKKALVYFSSGIGKTGVDNQSQIRATVNAAVRANVSFYPIDARGLVALTPAGDATQASPKGTGVFTGSAQLSGRSSFHDTQDTIYTLAADTGGKALLDSNDLTLGIKAVQADINSYYVLGYYSANPAQDGKYRHVTVKIASLPESAKIDYRKGYYAAKVWGKMNSSDKERQLEDALTLDDPFTDLPLALEVDYFQTGRDKYFVPITVRISGSTLDLSPKSTTDLDFIGQIRDLHGKLLGGVRDEIKLKLSDENAAQLARRHVEYDTGVTLPPGDYNLRFLTRENQNGKMGTFEMKFTVPDLTKDTSTVRMSSVVWSNQREPLAASIGTAGGNKKLLKEHPLVENGTKLIPDITRVFRKNQKLYVYFEVYDPGAVASPSVSAELAMFRGKTKAFESAPERVTKSKSGRPNTLGFEFQLPLSNITPGRYTCQVSVIDEQARKFGFARAPLVILQ
ncbi:MAG TPA: VWA domain-containing protein [Bryobacteraceae bacterium]|nr:VWA domain-containing protein [Bryobacteraceae bacterium]